MNRTRKRRRRRYTRRRRRGGFKFKRPKFKTPKFKMPKMNITKKLKKAKDGVKRAASSVGKTAKKGLSAVGRGAKKGLSAVGKGAKKGLSALKTPLGMAAGLGGLGSLAYLASSMGGFPAEKLKYFAKFGGMAIAPLLLLGSFMKPGARVVYGGLKKILAKVVTGSKGGIQFLINLVGIPIKGLMTIIGNLPTMMLAMGGFAGVAALASKNYLKWIWKTWRYIADGWASSPLLTWCEKKPDGTCRCPQILKIKKEDGKPVIVVEKAKKGWFSSSEGKGCFMNRQCPSGFICKKTNKWNPRGKCTQTSIPDITSPEPLVEPPEPIVEPAKPLVSNQPIRLVGGGKIKFNMTIEARTTKNGIKWKVKKSRGRTRKKRGGVIYYNPMASQRTKDAAEGRPKKKAASKKKSHTARKANHAPVARPSSPKGVPWSEGKFYDWGAPGF